MKGIVAYDSYYGNTKRVAEAIVEQVIAEGHEAQLIGVREKQSSRPEGDFAFVGSPIRFGGPTRKTKRFVKGLDKVKWRTRRVFVFATIGPPPKDDVPDKKKASGEKMTLGGGLKLKEFAKERSLSVSDRILYVEVKDGWKGPLVDDAIEKTKQYAHEVLQSMRK